jgi:RNA polymerase sigma-70 factor (ECF subfamily)
MAADDSKDLIQRASAGDAHAVDRLLERHLPGLRMFVRRNISAGLLARESSSDVVQSVCREVLQHVDDFEYQGEAAFRTWLYEAARRKLIDRLRYYNAEKRDAAREVGPGAGEGSLSGEEALQLANSLASPSREVVLREELQRLEGAFQKLSEDDRQVIRWIYLEGWSHAQVAERLACTEVASRKMLSRALARLSKQLVG